MEKKKNSTTKETGGGVERGDCKQVLRVSRSTTSLKGRPQWVQGFCGLPSVGIPGARAGLSEEWAFGGGGEDKGRAPEIPSRRPGGHSSHITERPSPVSSVCVCVSNAHVCVKHHEPRKGGREGRVGREEDEERVPHTRSEGSAVPSFGTHTTHTRPARKQQMQGQRKSQRQGIPGGTEKRTRSWENHSCPRPNLPRMEKNSKLILTRHSRTIVIGAR